MAPGRATPVLVAARPVAVHVRRRRVRCRRVGGSAGQRRLRAGRQPVGRHGIGVEGSLRQQKKRILAADVLGLHRVPQIAQVRRSPAPRDRIDWYRRRFSGGRFSRTANRCGNLGRHAAAGQRGIGAGAAWTVMDCSPGGGGAGIGSSGSACAVGASVISATNAPERAAGHRQRPHFVGLLHRCPLRLFDGAIGCFSLDTPIVTPVQV